MSSPTVERPGPPVKAAPPSWAAREARAMDGETLLRRMVGNCLAQVEPNADALARGGEDPEHVHQLRVGLRRLRSAVRAMKPFSSALPLDWESTLTPVFGALGESRDRHVLATTLAPGLRRAGAPLASLEDASGEPRCDVRAQVGAAAFQALLRQLRDFADPPPSRVREGGDEGSGLAHLVHRLDKLARQVTRAARDFAALPLDEQHRARKRLKRLRYLAEFAAPAFHRGDVRRWLQAVEPAQDALGQHIDRGVAARRFEAYATRDPRAWFAVGWLRAKGERSARSVRQALRRLRKANAFW
jgi:triphosphatase